MIPGVNPRQMKMAMKRMGIQQEDLDATEVIIKLRDREIVISNPQVAKVNMMGQHSYQITGNTEERSLSSVIEISDEDIQTVVDSAGVSADAAERAIRKHEGDLAAAIMHLKK